MAPFASVRRSRNPWLRRSCIVWDRRPYRPENRRRPSLSSPSSQRSTSNGTSGNPQSTRAGLYGSPAVRNAVEGIDRADRVEQIEGRERLTAVRQLLRRLLARLEHLEGFSVSLHELREVAPERIAAALANIAPPRILHRMRGRIRLGIPALRTNKDFAGCLEELIRAWPDVADVSINVTAGSVTIKYRTTVPDNEFQAEILASIGTAMHRRDGEALTDAPARRLQGAVSSRPAAMEEGTRPRRQRAR